MSVLSEFPKISPFLWMDGNAEEAANFYVSVFPNSRVIEVFRGAIDTPSSKAGDVLTVAFELDGVRFTALNGGPMFRFTEAVSFVVRCSSQEEIDFYWDKLLPPGQHGQCGWLKDKFGLSWQIVPENVAELMQDAKKMAAVMKMEKFDLAAIAQAGSVE